MAIYDTVVRTVLGLAIVLTIAGIGIALALLAVQSTRGRQASAARPIQAGPGSIDIG